MESQSQNTLNNLRDLNVNMWTILEMSHQGKSQVNTEEPWSQDAEQQTCAEPVISDSISTPGDASGGTAEPSEICTEVSLPAQRRAVNFQRQQKYLISAPEPGLGLRVLKDVKGSLFDNNRIQNPEVFWL